MSKVCKYYLKGICNFGSSCRFLHTGKRPSSSQDKYYEEDEYEYHKNSYEKHYENKFISKNKQSDYNPYEYKLDINEINHSLNDNNEKMPVIKYDDDYYSESYFNEEALDVPTTYHWNVNFDYSIKDEYKIKDYYGKSGHMSDAEKMKRYNSNAARIKNFFSKYEKESTNIHGKSGSKYKKEESDIKPVKDKEIDLSIMYEKDIKMYQKHIKDNLNSTVWPFSCYHPIGNPFPIQPVGRLNFIEISFEEIRFDFYAIKNMCADPISIHKQVFGDLVLKARNQREDLFLSLDKNLKDDMIATFEKFRMTKIDPTCQNLILPDNNSYWDMSIKRLNSPEASKQALESFSFVPKGNDKPNNSPLLKIMMQNDVYGKMDCDAFRQDSFIDYIPITPPPQNQCI